MATEHPPVCDYEGSDYQERFWDAGGRQYEHRVEQIALGRLLPTSGDHVERSRVAIKGRELGTGRIELEEVDACA